MEFPSNQENWHPRMKVLSRYIMTAWLKQS
jgi:hypothetical protein